MIAQTGYPTREVARIAGVPESVVRALVRDGVLTPRRGSRGAWLFSMPDVVLLRTAGELRGQVSARRLHEALRRLRTQLPGDRSLTGVSIAADGDRVVVHDGDAAWEPATGQGRLAFDVQGVARQIAPLAHRRLRAAAASDPPLTADQWYELGCDLEPKSPREARTAYEKALALEPDHARAHVNLGRIRHEQGDTRAAADHYRRALAASPQLESAATAAFNLGIACEDLGDLPAAHAAYERALELDPRNADAHFNLARLLERDGNRPGAVRHLRACQKLREAGE